MKCRTPELLNMCRAPVTLVALATLCVALVPAWARAGDDSLWSFGGHTKYQYLHTRIPGDSVLHGNGADRLQDHNLDLRLKVSARRGRWGLDTHLQFIAMHSDTLAGSGSALSPLFAAMGVINDERRWFDLTHVFNNNGGNASLLRLDRASLAYTGNKTVLRFGRQAVSWGNGLLFTPMDIFNPFDPTAVDKEYKSGDDMLYGQYLQDNGNDLQAVVVVRRDLTSGDLERDASSIAVKYHGFRGGLEYDLLLSEHYSERVLGLGLSTDLAGAVWRGDLVWNDAQKGSEFSVVAGASYSGVLAGHNWSGFLEYFYNGFGQADGAYSPAELADNPDLLNRVARGELYNLGRHYLGASVTLELTPLLTLTPNVFANLEDPSALIQVVLSWDVRENFLLTGALNVPLGPNGSEYGGIALDQQGAYLSYGASLFAQLAWYY
ncbi:MAG: hypothetical protein OQJ84_01945 [Xanthomonadales bacterium]|nr:hypothetical protein [Xanthomonadales bacterium]